MNQFENLVIPVFVIHKPRHPHLTHTHPSPYPPDELINLKETNSIEREQMKCNLACYAQNSGTFSTGIWKPKSSSSSFVNWTEQVKQTQ